MKDKKEPQKVVCSECGAELNRSDSIVFADRVFCSECLDRVTVVCDRCGDRIWQDRSIGDENVTLCQECYDDYYTSCDRCGRIIRNSDSYYVDEDSDEPYCVNCIDAIRSAPIKSYSYKPSPIFYGTDDQYMGVELEVDRGGEDTDNARDLLDLANVRAKRIYCKHDGSLNDGFELVSHPMTLEYHKYQMNWKDVFETALDLGYYSHNTRTCGLHVHCDRNFFGDDDIIQEAVIGRIVYFVEKHWSELVRFSRRTSDTLERWAARYATISPTTQETFKKAKDKRMGRYVAVNLENYETIEFRLFRGTLRYETFIATLQLVNEICHAAVELTDREMENLSWSDFVLRIDKDSRSELVDYLKSKRLYVNEIETVSESEEG